MILLANSFLNSELAISKSNLKEFLSFFLFFQKVYENQIKHDDANEGHRFMYSTLNWVFDFSGKNAGR